MSTDALILECFDSFRFVFTVQIAVWIFAHRRVSKAKRYWMKVLCMGISATLLALAHIVVFSLSAGTNPETWTGMNMSMFVSLWAFATFLLALVGLRWCRRISWTNAMSRWMLGVCLERFVTAFVHNWLFLIIVPEFRTQHPIASIGIDVLAYTLFFMLAMLLLAPVFKRDAIPSREESRTLCILYAASFAVLTIVSNASMGISEYDVPHISAQIGWSNNLQSILMFSTAMGGIIAVIIFLFQYAILHTALLQQESAMFSLLNEQRSRQYAKLTDNIDFINRKAHDIKHQIAALEFADGNRRSRLIQETQDALSVYDAAMRTGNDALDTLLTERNFFCTRHGIRLSCMLGGCDWNAFDMVDLFTLFGNALDNAIDYVMRFDNPDKRVISVSARQQGELIVISFDNYFEGELHMNGDLPATTKTDKASHGLGLKSIRMIAHRYNGDIRVDTATHVFTLQVSLVASNGNI